LAKLEKERAVYSCPQLVPGHNSPHNKQAHMNKSMYPPTNGFVNPHDARKKPQSIMNCGFFGLRETEVSASLKITG
jgi:hypothetical protein